MINKKEYLLVRKRVFDYPNKMICILCNYQSENYWDKLLLSNEDFVNKDEIIISDLNVECKYSDEDQERIDSENYNPVAHFHTTIYLNALNIKQTFIPLNVKFHYTCTIIKSTNTRFICTNCWNKNRLIKEIE